MSVRLVQIGNLSVSRMILGGNPFSGFSHQTPQKDDEMRHFYTTSRIKHTLRQAEESGINTHVGRADHHVIRYLMEYWDEGGAIQWFAQTCPEMASLSRSVDDAIQGGAAACFLHGGMMDYRLANNQLHDLPAAIEQIKRAGLPAGIAGHNPDVFRWAEKNLDVDFYMCSYYNAAHRDERAEHVSGMEEWFDQTDRTIMAQLIQTLSKPAIHYKVLAAGRNQPREALQFVARYLRPQDAVCIGVYLKEHPQAIQQDLELLQECLQKAAAST